MFIQAMGEHWSKQFGWQWEVCRQLHQSTLQQIQKLTEHHFTAKSKNQYFRE